MHVQPAHILALRLDLLRTLLGPGWLGFMRHARPDASGVLDEAAGWPAVERSYSRILAWLMPGLGYLARAGRCGPLAEANAEQAGGLGPDEPGLESAAEAATLEQPADPHDAPTRLLHLLRCGLAVSPAGIRTCAALTAEDLLHCIVPALAYLYAIHAGRLGPGSRKRGARTLVVLAGMPGSGKSVLAEVIARLAMLLPDWPRIQVVGMDGWHLPNEALRIRTIQDEFGRMVPLISRKGSAASFDVAAMATSMRQLLDDPGPLPVPVYDRQLHDPVPQGLTVDAPIVLLEGNYLLMDAQGYEQIARLSDGRIWLDVPLELARWAIVRRHAAAGRSLEEAHAKWRANDWPNSLAALRGRARADAVILTGPRRRMRFAHRPCGATARAPVTRYSPSHTAISAPGVANARRDAAAARKVVCSFTPSGADKWTQSRNRFGRLLLGQTPYCPCRGSPEAGAFLAARTSVRAPSLDPRKPWRSGGLRCRNRFRNATNRFLLETLYP